MPSFDRPKKQLWMIFMLGNSGMHFNQEPIIILICPDFRVPTEHPAVQEAVSFQLDRDLQIRLDCCDALWEVGVLWPQGQGGQSDPQLRRQQDQEGRVVCVKLRRQEQQIGVCQELEVRFAFIIMEG